MSKDDATKRAQARNTVYRLLKFRIRSEKEIKDKLKAKNVADELIDETVVYFKELGLIDDRRFAREWISSRLLKPFGIKRIRHELEIKGIDCDILEEELKKAFQDDREEEIVFQLARNQAERYKGIDPLKAKQRLFSYLSRRGFNTDVIYKTIRQLS